jgi:hypothetical protein
VRGINVPSTLSSLSLSCPFRPANIQTSFTPLFTPLGLGLVRFIGGFKEELGARAWRVLVSWFPISRAPRSLLGWHISCLLLLEPWAPSRLGVALKHPKVCGCPRKFVSPWNWVSDSSLIFVVSKGRKVA